MNTESAQQFVETNKVRANNIADACGDGRYMASKSEGARRMFGGTTGPIFAILAAANKLELSIKPQALVTDVLKVMRELNGEEALIGIHTDAHSKELGDFGCKFIKFATEGKFEFLSGEQGLDVYKAIEKTEHKEVVLEGEHKEQSVLMVHGKDWSVNSSDASEMNFVVDIDREKDYVAKILEKLNIEGLTFENVWEQVNAQMQKTALAVAAGKPIFDVNFDEMGKPTATFNSFVPSATN